MAPTVRIVVHSLAAAMAFYLFQFHVLAASQATSLMWAAAGAIGAAYLAWSQERRGR